MADELGLLRLEGVWHRYASAANEAPLEVLKGISVSFKAGGINGDCRTFRIRQIDVAEYYWDTRKTVFGESDPERERSRCSG